MKSLHAVIKQGSRPIFEPRGKFYSIALVLIVTVFVAVVFFHRTFTRYSCHVGTPGNPCFINVQFESSCSDACRKYLPSVNKAASFADTIAKPEIKRAWENDMDTRWACFCVPAEPVKPEIQCRRLSQSAIYSLYRAQLNMFPVGFRTQAVPGEHLRKG